MEPGESEVSELEFTPLDPRRPPNLDSQRRTAASRWLRSLQGRVALSVLVTALVAGALVGTVARATPDPLGMARAVFNLATPTETAIIPPGGDAIAVTNTVPWGVLRVDGRPPVFVQARPLGRAFILPRGVHHLVYMARYFDSLRCDFSVPQSPRDTCPVLNAAGVADTFQRVLDMRDTVDRLRDGQYQALVATISGALASISASATIQPGERYYDQGGQIRIAYAPMTFTVGLRPITPQDAYKGQPCALLCANEPDWTNPAAAPFWSLSIQSEPTWTITDTSGRRFNSVLPANPGEASATQLAVTLAGSFWRVSLSAADKVSILSSVVQSAAVVALYNQSWNTTATGATSGPNVAEGALVQSRQSQGTYDFLWRFGILYCADSFTHAGFPRIPTESLAGASVAKQLLNSMPA